MGYWPNEIFTEGVMKNAYADAVDWGGEVATPDENNMIQMGNRKKGSEATWRMIKGMDTENMPAYMWACLFM